MCRKQGMLAEELQNNEGWKEHWEVTVLNLPLGRKASSQLIGEGARRASYPPEIPLQLPPAHGEERNPPGAAAWGRALL